MKNISVRSLHGVERWAYTRTDKDTQREKEMAHKVLIFVFAIWIAACSQGVLGKDEYGKGISTCGAGQNDLKDQICPKGNDYKYVRIKTFNGRYLWAYPSTTDNKYVRTRCCGKNDAVGRKDSVHPGTRTTFRVHCSPDRSTVRFEVLSSNRGGFTKTSGYFLYADMRYKRLISEKRPEPYDPDSQFILKRWRGSVVGIKSARNRYWWTFLDDGHGYVPINKQRVSSYPDIPPMQDTFTLELVPRGCVEIKPNERIQAGPSKITPEECHRKPDRCYWTTGWGTRKRIEPGTCYYRKDTVCYQVNVYARESCPHRNAKDCEAANCCYDYGKNQCYRVKA